MDPPKITFSHEKDKTKSLTIETRALRKFSIIKQSSLSPSKAEDIIFSEESFFPNFSS